MIVLQGYALSVPAMEYWAMRDQSGGTWYWWVTTSRDIVSSATLPSFPHRREVALSISPTPYWLAIIDAGATTWYCFPTAWGEIQAQTTVPGVGTGYTGSPVALGLDLQSYALSVNIVGELTAVPQ